MSIRRAKYVLSRIYPLALITDASKFLRGKFDSVMD